MEEYDVICPVLHERRAAAIPCVTVESAHYLTSIRYGYTIYNGIYKFQRKISRKTVIIGKVII